MHTCISCSQKDFQSLLEFHDHPMYGQKLLSEAEVARDAGINFNIVRCNHCGLVQIGEKDNVDTEFYDDEYICTTGQVNFDYQTKLAKSLIEEFDLTLKKTIELGCGDGFFSLQLSQNGCSLYAIEPSGKAFEHAKKLGVNVERKYVNEVTEKFDFFVLRQVLEHIEDPNSFFQDVLSIVNPDFHGVIEVPRLENIYKKDRIFEFYPEHVAYYDAASLGILLSRHFTVDSILSTFDGQYLLAKVSRKYDLNKENINVDKLKTLLQKYESQNIGMWGAGAKGINVLALLGKKQSENITLFDGDSNKIGKFTPVTHIQVCDKNPDRIQEMDVIIISADMYKNEIVRELYEKFQYRKGLIFISQQAEIADISEYYQSLNK